MGRMATSYGQNDIVIWAESQRHMGRMTTSYGQNGNVIWAESHRHMGRMATSYGQNLNVTILTHPHFLTSFVENCEPQKQKKQFPFYFCIITFLHFYIVHRALRTLHLCFDGHALLIVYNAGALDKGREGAIIAELTGCANAEGATRLHEPEGVGQLKG